MRFFALGGRICSRATGFYTSVLDLCRKIQGRAPIVVVACPELLLPVTCAPWQTGICQGSQEVGACQIL
jgi:hypothetical protein